MLECAVAGRANYIISDDRPPLNLKQHAGIAILSAREFLKMLKQRE